MITEYTTLSSRWRTLFGTRVQKIPLDAGFGCPNRDGTISRAGCSFCNALGSGTGLRDQGLDLAGQWEFWRARFKKRYKAKLFMAYLQSFSNTHGPVEKLARTLEELDGLPDLAGLAVGTRPDCLDREKIQLLADFPGREKWLDLGLQSANNATLKRINRGHDAEIFALAARMAADAGLLVCAHVIAGLPGETHRDFLATVDFVNALPVAGIKLHNLYVCRGTPLARDYAAGNLQPLTLAEYARMAADALARLRPDIVVHRINGDPSGDELVAPAWAADKGSVMAAILGELGKTGRTQGCEYMGKADKLADLSTLV